MAKKIKCPSLFCGSTDVAQIGEKTRISVNLNPLHPFTLVNSKASKKQKFHCNKCGRVFTAKI